MEAAIRAINEGEIYRFFTKPCNEVDLAITIRQALQLKDLMAKSRQLLEKVRCQSGLLKHLEKEHPGITSVERSSSDAIIVDDHMDRDLEILIGQINKSLGQGKAEKSHPIP